MNETPSLRIIYMGSGEFAVPSLQLLAALAQNSADYRLVAVFSQPPRPSGRGQKLTPTPVGVKAQELQLPLFTPLSLRDEAVEALLKQLAPDLIIVASYGLLLPSSVLALPRYGALNLHGSLLPRWRGAAPIQRAIAAGDKETGVGFMMMEVGLDTGPVLDNVVLPIKPSHSSPVLLHDLAELAANHLPRVIKGLVNGSLQPIAQNHKLAVKAEKLQKEESQADWQESAVVLERKIRAFQPWPGVTLPFLGERVHIIKAELAPSADNGQAGQILSLKPLILQCGVPACEGDNAAVNGALRLVEVKRAGRPAMSGADFANGQRFQLGQIIA